jgi:hypothetical protein
MSIMLECRQMSQSSTLFVWRGPRRDSQFLEYLQAISNIFKLHGEKNFADRSINHKQLRLVWWNDHITE